VFDPKTLQHMLGHASIQQTFDRYGHMFPGAEQEAGRLLDGFLEAAAGDHMNHAIEAARA
jgi:integrase